MNQTTLFNRMPRIQEPLPLGEVKIPAPPSVHPPPKSNWFQLLLPLAGLFVMAGVYGGIRRDWTLALPMIAMSGLSATASVVGTLVQRRNHQRRTEEAKTTYAAALDQKKGELERLRLEQQRIHTNTNPGLETLLARARDRDPRLWERRPEDSDFMSFRLGIGELPSTISVSAPHPDMPDPRLEEAHLMEVEYTTVPQVPVTVSMQVGPLGIAGPPSDRISMARALICNLAVHHSPDEVHLLAIYVPDHTNEWQWLGWLPHTHALRDDVRWPYLACTPFSTETTLGGLLEELHRRQNQLHALRHGEERPAWPWLVLLVENHESVRGYPAINLLLSPESRKLNTTAIFLVDQASQVPMGCNAVIEIQPHGQALYSIAGTAGGAFSCWPEYADAASCEQLARCLAPTRVRTLQSDSALPSNVRLLNLMDISDITKHEVARSWKQHALDRYLQVPIGERRGNQPMVLDLDHTAHGPHGLIAGTTGSGKSELLQTMVIALALTHHPHDVGFVLVDFKGGGAFSDLVSLPHTLGLVTDLAGNLTERALVALKAEVDRRKQLFNDAGVNDIEPYQRLHWQGRVEEPLPRLVVIVDEFAELVSDYPDFMDGLIGIARVGRSLGLHLILATQSPAGVVKQQIWANAKFRICLRVESRQESMEMLHRPEAANLPRIPGRGYFQIGNNEVFEPFQVARVAGRYRAARDEDTPVGEQEDKQVVIAEISPLGQRKVLFDSRQPRERQEAQASSATDIEVVVQRLAVVAEQMGIARLPSPWPDPLPDHVTLPGLLHAERCAGWNGTNWTFDHETGITPPTPPHLSNRPWLGALLGLLDDPANQRQLPLLLKLAQQDGHLLVLGAPGSGKDMWVRTLVMSLAHTHTPDELHFYLLEFGGQALQVLKHLPHAGGVFTPLDSERVRRLLRRLLDSLDTRKDLCNQAGVDGLTRLRELQPRKAPPAIVVIITGFLEYRTLFQDEMLQLTRLIREGGPYGIHLILLGDRAGDIPTAISSVLVRRFALRLAEADEYHMVLGTRIKLSKEQRFPPGRGWYGRPPREFQTASPGHERDEKAQVAELQEIVSRMNRAWKGPRPEPVEVLPDQVPLDRVLSRIPAPAIPPQRPQLSVPIGLDGIRLQPVLVDLVNDGPDFIASSTPQGGKTTLLLTWALALAEFNSPQQVQFVLVSGRRDSLRPLAGLPHVLDHCPAAERFCRDGLLARLLAEIQRREALLSAAPSSADELPHIVAMFDDYDEFSNALAGEQGLQEGLLTLAKRGRDVNIHTVVTGPLPDMGGIAFRDPFFKQLRVGRSGFLLRVLDPADQNPLGLRMRASETKQLGPGRGYIVRSGFEQMLQVATPGDGAAVTDRVTKLQQRWADAGVDPASWAEAGFVARKRNGGE